MNIEQQRLHAKENALNEQYAIISFKIDGTIIECNDKFLELFNYEKNEIIGKHHQIFCDKNYVSTDEYKKFWFDLINGTVQQGEFRRIKKNAEDIFIFASYKPLINEKGEIFEILKFAQDITSKKLENLNYKQQIIAVNKSLAVIEFDINGYILRANDNFLNIMDYKLEDILGKHHSIFIEDDYKKSIEYTNFWETLRSGKFDSAEYLRLANHNRRVWIRATYNPIFDLDNNIIKIVKFAQDVTIEKLSSLYHFGQLEAINKSQAVIEFDLNGNILNVNELFLKAVDYEKDEIIGKHHSIFLDEKYKNSQEYKDFWEKLKTGEYQAGKFLRYGKSNKEVWIQATYTPILDIDKKPVKIVKFAQDITELENIKKDNLTNLGSREKLINDIKKSNLNNLAIIDINDFSLINDFYGYEIGDDLIIKFSEVLKKYFTNDFQLYRVYGDKFAVYNPTIEHIDFVYYLQNIMNKIFELTLKLNDKVFSFSITCGISFEDNEHIINTSEIINKVAKKKGLNLMIYSKELALEDEFERNILWTEKIKKAIKDDRIIPYYQPIFNNETNKIEKYEALVRLIDEDGRIISPYFFLDIAKKSKQYLNITKIVIQKVFEKFQHEDYEFSINLTVEDIIDQNLQEYLFQKIKEFNITNKLVIELVESEHIISYDPIYDFINKIKKIGCKLAIDDFGSGYSNFEYLVKINADYVKIDGSIIKQIVTDENSLEIVKSIISFCKKMNIKTIAEFISDEKLFEKVKELNIDYSQGFYISEPKENLN